MSTTTQRVVNVIRYQLGVEESQVTPEKSLVADLGADSLDNVQVCMAIEDEFGIEIPDDDGEKLQTVGDYVTYIEGRTS